MVRRRWYTRWRCFIQALTPSLPLAAGLAVGQALVWFLPSSLATLLLVLVGIGLLVRLKPFQGVFIGAVCGLVTAYLCLLTHGAPFTSDDALVLLQVEGIPGHRVPGEISFLGREVLAQERRLIRVRLVDLPWRNVAHVRSGELLWVRGPVSAVGRPLNPFSWEAWLWRKGVSGEMKGAYATRSVSGGGDLIEGTRDILRHRVQHLSGERRGGALFLSMAFGYRDVLSAPVEHLFSSLGLSHLLVVSGYQISLVFTVIFGALTKLLLALRPSLVSRGLALLLSLLCAGIYVALVGWEMSAVRALVAAFCVCGSLVLHREQGFAQRWGAALVAMQIVWPWAIFEVGVVLTFLALGGIGVGSILAGASRMRSLALITIVVWLFTTTFLILWNGSLSWGGLVLNLFLAAPWSVINCTVGVVAILLHTLAVPGAEWLVRGVFWVNESLVDILFATLNALGGGIELEHEEKWSAFLVCAALSVAVVVKGARLTGVRSAQILAR